jgi:AraC family L-rhamnose operon transcriptional activator RhaR
MRRKGLTESRAGKSVRAARGAGAGGSRAASAEPFDVSAFNDISRLPVAARFGGHHAQMLYCGVLGERWWRNYLHVHSFFELCHVFKGSGTFLINGTTHRVGPGDTLIAKPGEPHEIVSSRRQPLGIYFWAYTLSALPDAQKDDAEDALAQVLRRFPTTPSPVVRVQPLPHVLRLMTGEAAHRAPGYLEMINALFAKSIVDTVRGAVPEPPQSVAGAAESNGGSRTVAESLVQTAVHYLRDNLSRRFEVRDVAVQVNLSERQLRRLFQHVAGTSILAYLTNLRIERAAHLLLNSDMPIKQIAAAVGYPDTHYFTTLFGREKGTTPAAFRRNKGTEFLRRPHRRRNS